jgi:hypothetical protein
VSLNRISIVFALIFGLSSFALNAQVKPTPPPKVFKPETQNARKSLPSLNLPEYIITGSDVIVYSGYTKENLTLADEEAFSRRVGRGSRESWYGDPEPIADLLSPSVIYGNQHTILGRAGFGSFSTPYFEGWYNEHYANGDLNAHAQYISSDGHVPEADYKNFVLDLNGGSWLASDLHPIVARSRVQANMSYGYKDYGLYANTARRSRPSLDFRRSANILDLGADLVSRDNQIVDYKVGLFAEYTLLDESMTVTNPDSLLSQYDHTEFVFGLQAEVETHIGDFPVETHMLAAFTDQSASEGSGSNPAFFELRAASEHWFAKNILLQFSAELYSLANSDGSGHTSVHPTVRAEYHFDHEIHSYIGFIPEVQRNSMRKMLTTNPFVTLAPQIRHQETPIAIRIGTAYDDRKFLSINGYADYREINDYAAFSLLPLPLHQQWDVMYEGITSIFSVHVESQIVVSDKGRAMTEFVVRSSENDELASSVPYLPNYEISFEYSHLLPYNIQVSGLFKLLGDRKADDEDLGSAVFLGLEADYWFMKNAGVFLRLSNIIDQEYQVWQGYDALPIFIMAGIQARL